MINTVNTKKEQLENGYFKVGSGKETILIIGSCRAVPYVGFLDKWNNENDNRFTICFLDPFNWCFDLQDNRTDLEETINSLESDTKILTMIKSCDIFIHEFYTNFGMFNCNKNADKNIYQFGMKAPIDLTIPSFNDIFLLASDIVRFDTEIKKEAVQDYNVLGKLSPQTIEKINRVKKYNLEKFYANCERTDFPDFPEAFSNNYKLLRFFWSFNHVSQQFTSNVFWHIMRAIKAPVSNTFWKELVDGPDMYANNYTYLSEYDTEYLWDEPIKPLRESL